MTGELGTVRWLLHGVQICLLYRWRQKLVFVAKTAAQHRQNGTNLVRLEADAGQGIQEWSYTTTRLRYPQPGGSSPRPWSTAWCRTFNEAARYTNCKQLLLPTAPTTTDQIHCRQRHISNDLSWYPRLCCRDWTIVTHCWPVYHAVPSHHFNVYKMQLPVWCSILASVIMWHQRFSSCIGYPWSTESSTSCVHWCTRSTLDLYHSTWLTLCSQSLNPAIDLVRGPPTLPTTSNAALVRSSVNVGCFSHAGPATWNSLSASIKLTTDTNRFKKLLKVKAHPFHIAS